MDRPYSSKIRKSQGHPDDKFEASGAAKASLSGQSKKRPPSSFAGNVLKKKEEVAKDKTSVPGTSEANYDNTCDGVNPLPKMGVTPATADHSIKSNTNPTTPAIKKHLLPSIKAPIYPSSLLQHRITSCPVHRKPSEILAKSLSLNVPLRASPVGTMVKPNTKGNSRPCTAKLSSTTNMKSLPKSAQQSDHSKKQQSSQPITTSVKKNKKVTFTQETPSPQESSTTITDDTTLFNQPHPTADNAIIEDNSEMTSEEKCVPPILSSPAVKCISSARVRGIVNPPSKHDDSCDDDGDSIDEYEEDYEDESDGSYSETEVEEESQQSQAASSADENWPSSPVNTGQQHSSPSPDCIDDDKCQSAAGEENETSSIWQDAPSPVSCSFTANMVTCPSAAGETVKRKVPLYRRKSVFPFFSPIMDIPNTCSFQKLSRETPVHTAAPPTKSTEKSTSDEDMQATLDEMHEQLKVIVPAASNDEPKVASTNDDDLNDQPPQETSSKKTEAELYYDMICRYDYTPLKPIADDLVLLHTDLAPSEVCPTLNRSPSFIGEHNQEDGLLSGRSSPKLDIPKDRYCGHMIDEHPLAKYTQKVEKPVKEEQKSSVLAECSGEDDKGGVAANDDFMQEEQGEQAEGHPMVPGVEESSSKSSVMSESKETEHQVVEHVEDHPVASSEEDDSSSSGQASVENDGHDSNDNVELKHGEDDPMVNGEGEAFNHSSSSSEATSIKNGSQGSKENIETEHEVLEHVGDHPIVPETIVESERCDGKDNVEVYTLEQLAASFGHSVKMEGDTSSKKQKKHKTVPKYNSYEQWYVKYMAKEKAARQPPPILRSTSYKEACMQRQKVYLEKVEKCYSTPLRPPVRYKTSQTQFSKKLTLPPIVKPQQQQQTVYLIPIPPTMAPPTSGPLSAVRNIRRKLYQKKSLKEAVKLVPAHLTNYMLDSPQRCIEYAENLEKVKRKQQYSESLRQKQLMTWANKRQRCTRAQP